jgi:hypothetical protein
MSTNSMSASPSRPGLIRSIAHRLAGDPMAVPVEGRLSPFDGVAWHIAHGSDVESDGRGTISDQRTYQLIRQPWQIADRLFEIEFLDAGVEAYCFTFGGAVCPAGIPG